MSVWEQVGSSSFDRTGKAMILYWDSSFFASSMASMSEPGFA